MAWTYDANGNITGGPDWWENAQRVDIPGSYQGGVINPQTGQVDPFIMTGQGLMVQSEAAKQGIQGIQGSYIRPADFSGFDPGTAIGDALLYGGAAAFGGLAGANLLGLGGAAGGASSSGALAAGAGDALETSALLGTGGPIAAGSSIPALGGLGAAAGAAGGGGAGGGIDAAAADSAQFGTAAAPAGTGAPWAGGAAAAGASMMDPSIIEQIGKALGVPNLGSLLPLLKAATGIGGGLNTLFGKQSNQGDPSSLFAAGNQVWQTAQDPRQDLYNRTLQQTQDQSRAATSARGIGMSPVAAGIENDATRNFNIDWQNAQLGRQVAGAGTLANTYTAGTGRQTAQNASSAAGTNAILTGLGALSGPGATPGASGDLSWLSSIFNPGAGSSGGATAGGGGSGSYDPTAYLTYLNQQASQPVTY